jgi:hypothetical protein
VSFQMARAVARGSIAPAAQVSVVPASDWAVAAVGRDAAAVLVSGVAALGFLAAVQVQHAIAVGV